MSSESEEEEEGSDEETSSSAQEPLQKCQQLNQEIYDYNIMLLMNAKSLGFDEEQIALLTRVIARTLGCDEDSDKLCDLLLATGGATPTTLDILFEDDSLRLSPKQIITLLRRSANGNVDKLRNDLDAALENILDVEDEETLYAVSPNTQAH